MNLDTEVNSVDELHWNKIILELKAGKPIQYVLGETVFFNLTFKVSSAVLIPRPETEELVDWILQKVEINEKNLHFTILDIGTGSGCIAVTLKKYLPESIVTAMDISPEAMNIASSNAALNEVDMHFVEANIFFYKSIVKYNLIVSNPPYITNKEKWDMHRNVLDHEPHLALFVENENPLVFYEAIASFALTNLKAYGALFFEINESLANETIDMLSNKGFTNIELRKDIQGKDRMICCTLST